MRRAPKEKGGAVEMAGPRALIVSRIPAYSNGELEWNAGPGDRPPEWPTTWVAAISA
jgi:hypothetical protein